MILSVYVKIKLLQRVESHIENKKMRATRSKNFFPVTQQNFKVK